MTEIVLGIDGWALAREPHSREAMGIWGLLDGMPSQVSVVLVVPQKYRSDTLVSENIELVVKPVHDTPGVHLYWEQILFPELASKAGARLLHVVGSHAPLFAPLPVVVSPTSELGSTRENGFIQRLRNALGTGGAARAAIRLHPLDVPLRREATDVERLRPLIHPYFEQGAPITAITPGDNINLPERYVLVHGVRSLDELDFILDAWSWVAPSAGDDIALLFVGLNQKMRQGLNDFKERYHLQIPLLVVPAHDVAQLAVIYRKATLLLQVDTSTLWASPVHHAMAAGCPVVGVESPSVAEMVGEAGYLVPPADARALGAALLTVLVNDEVHADLAAKARRRWISWRRIQPDTSDRLLWAYLRATGVIES